jgi:hypothetical protein
MSRLLRRIAIAAGASLGTVGAALKAPRTSRPRARRRSEHFDKARDFEVVTVTPAETLEERLGRLEARVAEAELAGASSVEALAAIPELDRRLLEQGGRLELLHASVEEAEKRSLGTLEMVQQNFNHFREEIPALVETNVTRQMADLESRLQAEAKENWSRSMAFLEETIERKVSDRLGVLEKALMEQSASIGALRVRAEETDSNLQRLVNAVERIIQRGVAPIGRSERPVERAANRPPEAEIQKTQLPMARVFGALLALGIARLFTS